MPATSGIGYINMTQAQAAAAFQEFLEERGPALARLRKRLAADGKDPDTFLDGTPESLVPLWRWVLSRLTGPDAPGATDPASVPREAWPSWERHTTDEERVLSFESVALLDGLVSYLAAMVRDHAPLARWEIARDSRKRYFYNNRPVLVSGTGEDHNFLPGFPVTSARAALLGVRESPDDAIAAYARELIGRLNEPVEGTVEVGEPEPPFEAEDTSGEPGGYNLEIDLGDEAAHDLSDDIDRLVLELAGQYGVHEVIREDRKIILVRAPLWSKDELEAWVSQRL